MTDTDKWLADGFERSHNALLAILMVSSVVAIPIVYSKLLIVTGDWLFRFFGGF